MPQDLHEESRSKQSDDSANLRQLISTSIECLEGTDIDIQAPLDELKKLQTRLQNERFHLAILGQFKRGKSTFLNALLGDDLLPTAVVPLTAIPTFIEYGNEFEIIIEFSSDEKQPQYASGFIETKELLGRFATESGNPENKENVKHVLIKHPASVLKQGVVLIDTPGIGSTFKHNTETTMNFLSACDAALFMVSADPPITEVELEFLKLIKQKIPKIFFVLNKIDYLTSEELETAKRFLGGTIETHANIPKSETNIFPVSAKQALQAKTRGDTNLLEQSGLLQIEEHLIDFLANEKSRVLQRSIRRRVLEQLLDSSMRIELAIRSLNMPMDVLHDRIQTFQKKIDKVKQEQTTIADMLNGDLQRTLAYLNKTANEHRETAKNQIQERLWEKLSDTNFGIHEAQTILGEIIPEYFEQANSKLAERIAQHSKRILERHQQRTQELIESIRQKAAELFDIEYMPASNVNHIEMNTEHYWITHRWESRMAPFAVSAMEKLLPPSARRKRIKMRILEEIDTLVRRNIENIRWSIYQTVNNTFRAFASELEEELSKILDATYGAIDAAAKRRKEHAELVSDEIEQLESALKRIKEAIKQLQTSPIE